MASGSTLSSSADRQNVWGGRYIDDLILRDRHVAAGGDLGVNGSGLDERLYALQDANWNVIAAADTNGAVQERYTYSAYGRPEFRDVNFNLINVQQNGSTSSNFAWDTLYTGRNSTIPKQDFNTAAIAATI